MNSTKHCSCLWRQTGMLPPPSEYFFYKHNVFRDSAHWSPGVKTWGNPWNRAMAIANMHKSWWSPTARLSSYASGQTDRQTNRLTDTYSSQYFATLPGWSSKLPAARARIACCFNKLDGAFNICSLSRSFCCVLFAFFLYFTVSYPRSPCYL